MYMFSAMWRKPECRKPLLTIRHQSPCATPGPHSARSKNVFETPPLFPVRKPPPAPEPRNMSTLRPIRT
jgi:hypothetical protein